MKFKLSCNRMNKTIYMTYKKEIPDKVADRWKQLNPSYNIDFSLDNDCIHFLRTYFNDYIANLFMSIPQGMYKADLWRLCKLYVHGGVYADVDLVPHINIDVLDKSIDFYSCLSVLKDCIFQAFMVNFSKPRNPLFYVFLLSFLLNNPYTTPNGPTYDMYRCLSYMIDKPICPRVKYEFVVKIKIPIGASTSNVKYIPLYYFPIFPRVEIKLHPHSLSEKFSIIIQNHVLIVTRTDQPTGWVNSHAIDILFSKTSMMLFQEHWGKDSCAKTCFVSHYKTKILDSRDKDFVNHHWIQEVQTP